MKPVRLEMRAFGPYASVEVVDFRELGDRSLFLVHGPTGSGKTSILDAICFALYGDTSGSDRDGKHMRSDHADPSETTEVTLDFALGERDFRVARSPEQVREKKRGEGLTSVPAKATLWDRSGIISPGKDGRILATGSRDVTEEVEGLLGFRSDQFRQVIMLPQGEFRRLLFSKSDAREKILEALFRTDFYRILQEALKERAKGVKSSIEFARRERELVLNQADADDEEDLVEKRDGAKEELDEAKAEFEKVKKAEEAARKHLSDGEKAAEKLAELAAAREETKLLEKERAGFEKKAEQLAAARKATALVRSEEAVAERENDVEDAAEEVSAAKEVVEESQETKGAADDLLKAENARKTERKEAATAVTQLTALAPKVKALGEAQKAEDDAARALTREKRAKDGADEALKKQQSELTNLRRELSEAGKSAAKVEGHEEKLEKAERQYHDRLDLENLRKTHEDAEAGRDEAREAVTEFEERLEEARESLDSASNQLKETQDTLIGAEKGVAQIDGLRKTAEEARRVFQRRTRLAEIQDKELPAASKATKAAARSLSRAEVELAKRRDDLEAAQDALRDGQAAVLAQSLVPDEPCPVCGSTDHPRPAPPREELPSEESLEHQRESIVDQEGVVEEARNTEQASRQVTGKLESEAATLEKELGKLKTADLAELKRESESADEVLAEAEASTKTRDELAASKKRLLKDEEDGKALVKKLDDELKRAQKSVSEAEKEFTKLSTNISSLEKRLGTLKNVDPDELERKQEAARSAVDDAKAAGQRQERLSSDLEAAEESEKELKERLKAHSKAVEAASRTEAERAQSVVDLEADVPKDMRLPKALDRALKKAGKTANALETALEEARESAQEAAEELREATTTLSKAKKAHTTAKRRAKTQREKFKAGLTAAGFKSDAAYESAKLDSDDMSELDAEIKLYEGNLKAAEKRLDRAKNEAKGVKKPNLAKLTSAVETAEKESEGIQQLKGELSESSKQLKRWLKDLRKAERESKKFEKEYETIGYIADVANGKNDRRVTFQRFVLGALLDDVLREASVRLTEMSKGRFALQRALGQGDRRKTGGLDLEVTDSHTGTSRPVQSLSGGESFLASLSLALALAEVVQAYTGGVYLETIFVDEGFGSLDSEALELAVRTLIDLQSGGRLVGIISHVSELKELVDARLEVVPDLHGSSTRFVV